MLLETTANGTGSTYYLLVLAAAAIGTAAGLAAASHGVLSEVRSSASRALAACCRSACMSVQRLYRQRCGCCAVPASRPCRPRLTCHFPRTVHVRSRHGIAAEARRKGAAMGRCGPLGGTNGRQRPVYVHAGRRRWRRRDHQHGWGGWGARGGSGGLHGGRARALRACRFGVFRPDLAAARDRRRLDACKRPARLRAGWGLPGGGPRPRRKRAERRGRVCGPVIAARTRACD